MRALLPLVLALCVQPAWAGFLLSGVAPVSIPGLPAKGAAADPQWSPDGRAVSFEFLGEEGDTQEVFVSDVADPGTSPLRVGAATRAYGAASGAKDPFSLRPQDKSAVSESVSWGPPKGKGQRMALAATREAVERGAPQVSFDIYLVEPGRKRFLTTHPENDAYPAFSPDGDFLAFSSGSSGQGDLYLFHFFAESDPLLQLTFETGGAELYPTWDPGGGKIAFVGHLGGVDHLYLIDDVRKLVAEKDPARRRSAARSVTRDLTPGRRLTCLAPSFSPDGKWIAFYAREGAGEAADLYVVPTAGGEPRRVLGRGLPESRRGPRWSPQGDGFFAVLESAERMNPLVWVPLHGGAPQELTSGTQLNGDPAPKKIGDALYLLFTAQGAAESSQKRWRRIYWGRLTPERAN